MFNAKDIEIAANALANQLAAGIKLREAVGRMAKLQPRHAELWYDAADGLARGTRLSQLLEDQWPEDLVAAVKAGEEANILPMVFKRIAEAMAVKSEVKKIYSKLVSPALAFLMGVGVFLFFMVSVIPTLSANLEGNADSVVNRTATFLHWAFTEHGLLIAGAVAALVAALVLWVRQPENRDTLMGLALQVPVLGQGLTLLSFGIWAKQMALLASAGMPIKQQLLLSRKTLPSALQDGVLLMAREVQKRGVADAADPERQAEGDPRTQWPFYISTAFLIAHETGRVDEEMQRCAPLLIEDGLKKISQFIGVADLVAKTLAAVMIGLPLVSYFMQMASSLTKSFGS
ncbi:MAG: type II secretion system F family protein [Halomonas sp.]|nr:type II secretion system F family protein [Halomonas sp.]MDM7481620.1 type II secretion system F family protein [Halomonas sp.]